MGGTGRFYMSSTVALERMRRRKSKSKKELEGDSERKRKIKRKRKRKRKGMNETEADRDRDRERDRHRDAISKMTKNMQYDHLELFPEVAGKRRQTLSTSCCSPRTQDYFVQAALDQL